MFRTKMIAGTLAMSALSLTMATPAFAGKANDLRRAIAAAQAKIDTAHTMGAGHMLPAETAQAEEALTNARNAFKDGRKDEALEDAAHATALADTAIGQIQSAKDAALAAAHDDRNAAVADASAQVADAQAQAAAANQRAADAAQSAQAAQAAALAAATPPAPAKVETTVTTSTPVTTRKTTTTTRKKVVRRPVRHTTSTAAAGTVKTTTTVTTGTP